MSQAGNNNQCIVALSLALYTFNVAAGDEATVVKLIHSIVQGSIAHSNNNPGVLHQTLHIKSASLQDISYPLQNEQSVFGEIHTIHASIILYAFIRNLTTPHFGFVNVAVSVVHVLRVNN